MVRKWEIVLRTTEDQESHMYYFHSYQIYSTATWQICVSHFKSFPDILLSVKTISNHADCSLGTWNRNMYLTFIQKEEHVIAVLYCASRLQYVVKVLNEWVSGPGCGWSNLLVRARIRNQAWGQRQNQGPGTKSRVRARIRVREPGIKQESSPIRKSLGCSNNFLCLFLS